MIPDSTPPPWRLPQGVNAALWRYAHTPRLADEEDAYFAEHPLFEADARILDDHFVEPGPLVDLGCGAGRLSLHFARRGFEVTAVDLSAEMLRVVGAKAQSEGRTLRRVRANLCDLRCLPDEAFRYVMLMFSTLGMVRGRPARRQALAEAARVLRPDGRVALHAHNLWLNLADAQGRRWLLSQIPARLSGSPSAGDRRMTYRGIPDMEVHLYGWGELRQDLRAAGLVVETSIPLDAVTARTIPAPWFFPSGRAGGWIVFARRA